jgi:hypothetical protein
VNLWAEITVVARERGERVAVSVGIGQGADRRVLQRNARTVEGRLAAHGRVRELRAACEALGIRVAGVARDG